jgi:D-alanyl-D-alanine carboxypeptidase
MAIVTGQNHYAALLRDILAGWQSSRGIPGLTAAVVMSDGHLVEAAAGMADREQRLPMTPDSVLMQASVGKIYAGAVAAALAREGKLDLDRPVAAWLGAAPWFCRLANADAMTTRMLLNHTSGLGDYVHQESFQTFVRQHPTRANMLLSPAELIAFILDQPPLFPAGSAFAYTDAGYLVAGLVIEQAAGRSYYDELAQRFLQPLQLLATYPAITRRLPRLTQAYRTADNPYGLPPLALHDGLLNHHPGNEWTGGGLASTAGDMARFGHALFAGDAVMPGYGEMARAQGIAITSPAVGVYGLGVFASDGLLGRCYGHGGWMPGYRSDLCHYADHGFTVAVMANTDIAGILDGQGIMDIRAEIAQSFKSAFIETREDAV